MAAGVVAREVALRTSGRPEGAGAAKGACCSSAISR